MTTKQCSKCGEEKSLDQFYGHRLGKYKKDHLCVLCRCNHEKSWRQDNPEKRKAYLRKSRYGITSEEYSQLRTAQDNKCAICFTSLDEVEKTVVDHCHSTGRVRGILCNACNTAIGLLKDSPDLLTKALAYLQKHSY